MNKENEQRLYQAIGIVNLAECVLDRGEEMTKKETEFLQQSLSGAASLLSQVVEARETE